MATRIKLSRRSFLSALSWPLLGQIRLSATDRAQRNRKFRAAIIGHTGHGDYGHDHDLIFNDRPDVEVVAVADAEPGGRQKAVTRAHALRAYADYREMLAEEKPELVSIAPRWTDEHHAMAMAALEIGAHVYLEKPITGTLAEADEVLTKAKRIGRKIVVAHQMRLAPNIVLLKDRLSALTGPLVELRAQGKQDQRAGGEDLVVLGVHLFDLMRLFLGNPRSCEARVLQRGREITVQDAHEASERIGPIAGDDIQAQFEFDRGVRGSFESRVKHLEPLGPWALELIGIKGRIRIMAGMTPKIYRSSSKTNQGSELRPSEWELWSEDPTRGYSESERGAVPANRRVVDDWMESIAENRQPTCSGEAGLRALEMAMAVFASGLKRMKVEFPLQDRKHPLQG